MSIGYPTDKATIDARVGNSVIALRNQLEDVTRIKAWIDTQTDAQLIALGYVQADVDVLRPAFTDLANLAKVANGQATQAQANNFFFWAGKLTGLN